MNSIKLDIYFFAKVHKKADDGPSIPGMIEVHVCVSTLYQHVSKLKQKTGCHSNIIHSLNTHVVRHTKVV